MVISATGARGASTGSGPTAARLRERCRETVTARQDDVVALSHRPTCCAAARSTM
ncbi:hypothetical protein [Streptomyces chattanoogensis]|uniref:hypothetical protein n=1 Tax=Streptomyces chattanoogensis TaxID=66876 RepID=UPI000A699C76|nr:hypothetical protein [Streptomyces chattanoogensis]